MRPTVADLWLCTGCNLAPFPPPAKGFCLEVNVARDALLCTFPQLLLLALPSQELQTPSLLLFLNASMSSPFILVRRGDTAGNENADKVRARAQAIHVCHSSVACNKRKAHLLLLVCSSLLGNGNVQAG